MHNEAGRRCPSFFTAMSVNSETPELSSMPAAYEAGYRKACLVDPQAAKRYVRFTRIGDPAADALMEMLADEPEQKVWEWLGAGIHGGPEAVKQAPAEVRHFFECIEPVPPWFRMEDTKLGCRAFHRHSRMFIGAFVAAVLVEGFSTLISQSFSITGRLIDQGVRRLKQNNRHVLEIFLPGGLDRRGDGWALSVRIRLVHARVRKLLTHSAEWDGEAWGVPLSASHIGFATAVFSALLLKRAGQLGVRLSLEERQSFMQIWRYSGHLMGVPEELLFRTEEEALELHRIGVLCEPPPSDESILLANGLIQSAPLVAGITEPAERRALAAKIYAVSRGLIGDSLADQLHFPQGGGKSSVLAIVWRNRIDRWLHRLLPGLANKMHADQFQRMLEVSLYPEEGMRFRMPGTLHAEKDAPL